MPSSPIISSSESAVADKAATPSGTAPRPAAQLDGGSKTQPADLLPPKPAHALGAHEHPFPARLHARAGLQGARLGGEDAEHLLGHGAERLERPRARAGPARPLEGHHPQRRGERIGAQLRQHPARERPDIGQRASARDHLGLAAQNRPRAGGDRDEHDGEAEDVGEQPRLPGPETVSIPIRSAVRDGRAVRLHDVVADGDRHGRRPDVDVGEHGNPVPAAIGDGPLRGDARLAESDVDEREDAADAARVDELQGQRCAVKRRTGRSHRRPSRAWPGRAPSRAAGRLCGQRPPRGPRPDRPGR